MLYKFGIAVIIMISRIKSSCHLCHIVKNNGEIGISPSPQKI